MSQHGGELRLARPLSGSFPAGTYLVLTPGAVVPAPALVPTLQPQFTG